MSALLAPPALLLLAVFLPNIPVSIHNAEFLKSSFGHCDFVLLVLQIYCMPLELFLTVYSALSAILGVSIFIVGIGTITVYSEGMRLHTFYVIS